MWSLGATLYAAVEGRSPYGRESVLETLSALAVDEPDPIRLAGPLKPVISGLLRRDPAQRIRAGLAADMLRRVAKGETVEEAPVKAKGRAAQVTQPLSRSTTPRTPLDSPRRRINKIWRTVVIGASTLGVTAMAGIVLSSANLGQAPVTPTVSATPAAPPPPGIAACEAPPRQAQPVTNGRPPPGQTEVLPGGWSWFTDPGWFTIAVPPNFVWWRAGNTVCFRDPYGMRVLGVVQGRLPARNLPDFHEIREDKEVITYAPQVEWEFTYSRADRPRHAIALVTTKEGTMFFATDEDAFTQFYGEYGTVKAAFRPASPLND